MGIREGLEKIAKERGIERFEVFRPKEEFGDYSTNLAILIAKKEGRNPRDVAEEIANMIEFQGRVEVAGNGFINFWLDDRSLLESAERAISFRPSFLKGKRIMVEYTDPNPFKVLHIGHLFSNAVGESIARMLEYAGAEVKRANYQGDVGLHVAKAVWGIRKMLEGRSISEIEGLPLKQRIEFLGKAYALGSTAYEDDEKARVEIRDLNRMIYERDPAVREIYEKGRAWSLEYFEQIYRRLGTRFDFYFFESETGEIGKRIVMDNLGKVFKESEGAIVFPGEEFGLHTRVFINSLGLPTYEAKDLGLAFLKQERWKHDISIIITANEVDEYFKVVLKALEMIDADLASRTVHLSHGFLRLEGGKMSSRKGNVIAAEDLLDEVKDKIKEIVKGLGREISDEDADKIGVAAVKYALLRSAIGKDIVFSFEKSLSFEGDSGPYLLYTYARSRSLLRKAEREEEGEMADEDRHVLRWIERYPEVLEEAIRKKSPHLLAKYAFELCQRFNSLYASRRFVENGAGISHRLLIARAVSHIIRTISHLLGFEVLERM